MTISKSAVQVSAILAVAACSVPPPAQGSRAVKTPAAIPGVPAPKPAAQPAPLPSPWQPAAEVDPIPPPVDDSEPLPR